MDAQLAAQFRASLSDYVSRLEVVQSELFALYRRKRAALATADVAELQTLLAPETEIAKRLTSFRNERQQLLMRAGQFGAANGSLAELAIALGVDEELRLRIERCRSRSTELRREGWVHWVVAHRSIAQTSNLLDLIAHRGDRPPTYDGSTSSGGTLLDTSA